MLYLPDDDFDWQTDKILDHQIDMILADSIRVDTNKKENKVKEEFISKDIKMTNEKKHYCSIT